MPFYPTAYTTRVPGVAGWVMGCGRTQHRAGTDMSDNINSGRRSFVAFGLLAAGAWRYAANAASQAAADASGAPLSELAYGQVRFGPGPLDQQARENHRLVLSLDEDA